MKRLLYTAAAIFIINTVYAQSNSSAVRFGVKAGVNLPKYNITNPVNIQTSTITNFHISGYMEVPINSTLSFQPGLSFQKKGGEVFYTTSGLVGGDVLIPPYKSIENTIWLEVPANIVAKFPGWGNDFFIGAGPYAALGIAGRYKSSLNSKPTDISFGNSPSSDIKASDLGLNFIGGIELKSGQSISIGYGLGLTDLRPHKNGSDLKKANRVLSFSVGHSF